MDSRFTLYSYSERFLFPDTALVACWLTVSLFNLLQWSQCDSGLSLSLPLKKTKKTRSSTLTSSPVRTVLTSTALCLLFCRSQTSQVFAITVFVSNDYGIQYYNGFFINMKIDQWKMARRKESLMKLVQF